MHVHALCIQACVPFKGYARSNFDERHERLDGERESRISNSGIMWRGMAGARVGTALHPVAIPFNFQRARLCLRDDSFEV